MTEKLYDKDSHRKEFEAVVTACEENEKKGGYRVVLDQTAFFPEGGGQFGDVGRLDEVEVTDTREKGGVIYHETKEALEPGRKVKGKIDFAVRFDRMQQHSGEHILSGLVHHLYGYDNVGFHLGAEATTLDFNGELSEEQVRDLELRANRAVCENVSIQVLYPTKEQLKNVDYRSKIEIEGQIRIVSIPGYDICACCAPHVDRTGEIGLIKIISCERHRGGCRMTILCGMRALMDYQRKQQNVTEVSVALSARPEKIGEAVLHVKEQLGRTREQLNRMQELYLGQKLMQLTPEDRNVCIIEEELDHIAARNFINSAMEMCEGICGALIGTDEGGYHYILGSRTVDLRVFSKTLNERFQGKGGGKPQMVQGSLTGAAEEIRKMIMET
ncbi:MAG TPA: hypothetical protein DD414_08485 [Lachnospiraceae bacterium]|nr:hypothetical protein [Lachnospiraceae bacterium]